MKNPHIGDGCMAIQDPPGPVSQIDELERRVERLERFMAETQVARELAEETATECILTSEGIMPAEDRPTGFQQPGGGREGYDAMIASCTPNPIKPVPPEDVSLIRMLAGIADECDRLAGIPRRENLDVVATSRHHPPVLIKPRAAIFLMPEPVKPGDVTWTE